MREICTLRATWRGLDTEPRVSLYGHEGGNPGHSQGKPYGPPRQSSTLPGTAGFTFLLNTLAFIGHAEFVDRTR